MDDDREARKIIWYGMCGCPPPDDFDDPPKLNWFFLVMCLVFFLGLAVLLSCCGA